MTARAWTCAALACAALAAAPARADLDGLRVRGLLSVVASGRGEGFEANYFNAGGTPFDPYHLRLFFEGAASPAFSFHAQVYAADRTGLGIFGAYAMWTPDPDTDLHVLAGKIPWVIGTWGPRTYALENPLIGQPMMAQYHTSLSGSMVPPSADALLAAAGSGQYGVDYGSGRGWRGMPILYDQCWDAGLAVTGSARPFELAAAVTNNTPSTGTGGADRNGGKSVMGRIGFAPAPALRVGVSGSIGPYLPKSAESALAGRTAEDFDQRLLLADLELLSGRFELRGEGFHNTFETATVGELETHGGYLELRVGLGAAWYAAARGEALRHGELAGASGVARPWDEERDRWEGGVGWRIQREATLKAVVQRNVGRSPGRPSEFHDLVAVQLAVGF